MKEDNLSDHWNAVYENTPINTLGWYEENTSISVNLIKETGLSHDARMFHAGAGASQLINDLLELGYQNIIVNDFARSAIEVLQHSIPSVYSNCIEFITDDLTNPSELLSIDTVDLWHDRAVLHFFTEDWQKKQYFDLLKKVVRKEGYVILSEFSLSGAKKCSGLDVCNYDATMLEELLGTDFQLIKTFDYLYKQPSGDSRPFVYTLFKRID